MMIRTTPVTSLILSSILFFVVTFLKNLNIWGSKFQETRKLRLTVQTLKLILLHLTTLVLWPLLPFPIYMKILWCVYNSISILIWWTTFCKIALFIFIRFRKILVFERKKKNQKLTSSICVRFMYFVNLFLLLFMCSLAQVQPNFI